MHLPVRLGPLPDELFGSWFVRLAHAHGAKVHSLAYRILGRDTGWRYQGDIDRGGNDLVMSRIAEVARLPVSQVLQTTLSAYTDVLWCGVSARGAIKWVRPLRDRAYETAAGQQLCPQCLQEDEIPYLRRTWRLSLQCMCPRHSCLLVNHCQVCGADVMCHKSDLHLFTPQNSNGVTLCWQCRADFRLMKAPAVYEPELAEMQSRILNALQSGLFGLGNQQIRSTLFFDGLWMLWSFWDEPKRSEGMSVDAVYGYKPRQAKRYKGIDAHDASRRLALLKHTTKYFQGWPEAFIRDMQACGLSSSKLFQFCRGARMQSVPYWLWEPVYSSRNLAFYVPTDKEIEHTINYVRMRDGEARVGTVCKALNMAAHCNVRVSAFVRRMNALASVEPALGVHGTSIG
ncbi:TniQ family protein [Variovorax sp. PCZ-1]|uniref:TniQ family protein n=1 Tax=Variovorax sp. PCZ-1 TaxID=2835533 RepID=UPI0020BE2556|nr:TniQ family protein [Variovorax sp. PCZ-1]